MPAGTDYKAKFDGLRGAMMALQTQSAERIGSLEQQVRASGSESTMLQEKLSAAELNITELAEQLSGLSAIQEEANKVTGLEAQASRLEVILRFPEIVGKTEQLDVSEEGEDEKFERVNPFLDALLSSTLGGDAFKELAEQMASQLGTGEWAEGEKAPGQVGPPPLPTPIPSGSLEDLRKQAMEAQRAGDHSAASKLWDKFAEKRAQGS